MSNLLEWARNYVDRYEHLVRGDHVDIHGAQVELYTLAKAIIADSAPPQEAQE